MNSRLQFHLVETELGWVGLVLSQYGLRRTTLPRQSRAEALRDVMEMGASEPAPEQELTDLPERISALASGRYASLALHIDWTGVSPFRRAVLEAAMEIPPGTTRSYSWLAEKVGNPRAARAVGRVMATNPIPIIIPCHRVIGSDGGLHGYGSGLDMKARLLRSEGATWPKTGARA